MTAAPPPQNANQLYDQALLALATKDRATARQILATVVVLDPRHEEAWLQLSTLMDDVAQSIECLQHVIALNPTHAKARLWLRRARDAQARFTEPAAEPAAEPVPEPPMDDPNFIDLEPADQPVPRLGRYLLDYGFLTADHLAAGLAEQVAEVLAGQPRFLGDILISQGTLTADHLNFALREQARVRAEVARAQPEAALD
jgi:hypothetical protein